MHSQLSPVVRFFGAALTAAALAMLMTVGIARGDGSIHSLAGGERRFVASVIESSLPYTTETHRTYLPLVFGPPPKPQPPLIANGDFESGRVGWSEYSAFGQVLIRSQADLGVIPRGGSWAVSLGASDDEISMLSQGVAIPADRACLEYWQWTVSSDACNADYGGIGVNGNWLDVFSLCSGTATAGWVRRQVNMTNYTTNSVAINVAVVNDYSSPSTLYVDDISLQPTAQCANLISVSLVGSARASDKWTELMTGRPIIR